jgi:hypothetical protein
MAKRTADRRSPAAARRGRPIRKGRRLPRVAERPIFAHAPSVPPAAPGGGNLAGPRILVAVGARNNGGSEVTDAARLLCAAGGGGGQAANEQSLPKGDSALGPRPIRTKSRIVIPDSSGRRRRRFRRLHRQRGNGCAPAFWSMSGCEAELSVHRGHAG